MTIQLEVLSSDRSQGAISKGEQIPCPFYLKDLISSEVQDRLSLLFWTLQKTYDIANPSRECREVVLSIRSSSITGKPACLKD